MLGNETDLILIDTKTGKVYNLGASAGVDDVNAMMEKLSDVDASNVKYHIERFVLISGIELGIFMRTKKNDGYVAHYNKRVERKGKYFASHY